MHTEDHPKIRWGILGTGNIARQFAVDAPRSASGVVVAVASRQLDRAKTFAAEHGIPDAYGSYEDLLDADDVDAVYISLPNHLHSAWVERCAEQGKHILCEKPLALNRAQAETAFDSAERQGVLLVEGFMYRTHPQIARLLELVADDAIGEVRVVEASFGKNMHDESNIRMSNAMGGGAILDLGSYGVSISRLVVGAATGRPSGEPTDLRAVGHIGGRSRVDEWSAAVLTFDNDIVASIVCGNRVDLLPAARIWGDRGSIILPNPWFAGRSGAPGRLVLDRPGQAPSEEVLVADRPIYALEIDAFSDALRADRTQTSLLSRRDSLGNMATLDAWRAQIGLRFDGEDPATGTR